MYAATFSFIYFKTGSLIDIIIVWTQGKGEQDDAGRKMLDGDEREEDRRREKRSVKREMVEWEQSVREKYATADLPRHYRGYEALLEEDTAPVPHIPTGSLQYNTIRLWSVQLKSIHKL